MLKTTFGLKYNVSSVSHTSNISKKENMLMLKIAFNIFGLMYGVSSIVVLWINNIESSSICTAATHVQSISIIATCIQLASAFLFAGSTIILFLQIKKSEDGKFLGHILASTRTILHVSYYFMMYFLFF
jgi:hypothetical protein